MQDRPGSDAVAGTTSTTTTAAGSRGVLSTLGLAHKIDDDWTLLGRNAYALTESKTGGTSQLQERVQLGVAYRDTATNRVNGLARYEFKREDGGLDFDRRTVHVVSLHADLQVSRGLMVPGEYAAKHDPELIEGRWVAGNAQLASVRVTRDLGERFDVGLAARVLGTATLPQRTASIGAELGYRVIENLWLSAGYNFSGFRDRDLADDGTTQAGVHVRMRFRFDENVFGAKVHATAKAAPWVSPHSCATLVRRLVLPLLVLVAQGAGACTGGGCVVAGPRLASLSGTRGPLLNALLGSLLGSSVNVKVADWNALASGNVSLLSTLNALQRRWAWRRRRPRSTRRSPSASWPARSAPPPRKRATPAWPRAWATWPRRSTCPERSSSAIW